MLLTAQEKLGQSIGQGDEFTECESWWSNNGMLARNIRADDISGFAARLLFQVGIVKNQIMGLAPNSPTLFLVRDVLRLAAQYNALKAEWIDGPDVAASRDAQRARGEGGRQKARAGASVIQRRHKAWQTCAERIWRERPDLTKAAVARAVATKYRAEDELSGAANTIRAVINKPD